MEVQGIIVVLVFLVLLDVSEEKRFDWLKQQR
jgi:hypothetical protein